MSFTIPLNEDGIIVVEEVFYDKKFNYRAIHCTLNKKCFTTMGRSMEFSLSKCPKMKHDVVGHC